MDRKTKGRLWCNPFDYIAGGKALLIGMGLMMATSFIGSLAHIWFPGVLDLKLGYEGSFWIHLATNLISWMILTVVLFLLASFLSTSRVRLIDMAGTLAFARAPQLLATLTDIGGVTNRVLNQWLWQFTKNLPETFPKQISLNLAPTAIKTWEWALTCSLIALQLLSIIWMVALMYHAYRISSNLKGGRVTISFIIGLLLAEVLSVLTVFKLIIPML